MTFKREVKIKEICFNLNNIRLRDCELGPIVNRDLTRRIRTVAGLTADKRVVSSFSPAYNERQPFQDANHKFPNC